MAEEEELLPTPFKDMKVGTCYYAVDIGKGGHVITRYAGRLAKKTLREDNSTKYELVFNRLERDYKRGPNAYKHFEHKHYPVSATEREYYEVPCEHLNVAASERRKHALLAWGLQRPSIKERLEQKFKKPAPVAAPTAPVRSSRSSTRKSPKSPKKYMNLGASSSNSNSNSAGRGRKTRRSSSSSHRSIGSIGGVKSRII
jgi:hypothetical protein